VKRIACGKPLTESQILAAIRVALGREPDLVLWRLSQGGAVSRKGQTYRAGLSVNGASDLIGILSETVDQCVDYDHARRVVGRWFCLEIKSAKGIVSNEQRMFIQLVRQKGGFAAVVRSVPEALAALERARRGEYD
jgi:hypothetical protein